MADTIETSLQIVLQEIAANDNTWGTILNENWQKIVDARAKRSTISSLTGGTRSLTDDEQRAAVLKFTGTLASNQIIKVNDAEMNWVVENATTGNYTLTVQTETGTGIVVPQGDWMALESDGTDVLKINTSDLQKVADGSMIYATAVGGTANAITITAPFSAGALVGGMVVRWLAGADNTDATTVNLNGIGVVSLVDEQQNELIKDTIKQNSIYDIVYNATLTKWQLKADTSIRAQRSIREAVSSFPRTVGDDDSNKLLDVDTSAGAQSILLDAAANLADGFRVKIRRDGANTLTIDPDGSETIDGAATLDLVADGHTVVLALDKANTNFIIESSHRFLQADDVNGYEQDASVQATKLVLPAGLAVESEENTPPGSPADGEITLVGTAPTGVYIGHAKELAFHIDGAWHYVAPYHGAEIYDRNLERFRKYDGSNWIDAAAADKVRLGEVVVSSSQANVDFTSLITSTYKRYLIRITGAKISDSGVRAHLRVSTDNGSTFKAGASDYLWSIDTSSSNTAVRSAEVDGADAQIKLTGGTLILGNDTNDSISGDIHIYAPTDTDKKLYIGWDLIYDEDGFDNVLNSKGSGKYNATTAVDALRLLLSAGTWEAGTFSLWGVVI